jgi:hypothetical protein
MMLVMPVAMLLSGGALALSLFVLVIAFARRRGTTTDDLGRFSQQWMAQHKASSRHSQF